MQRHQTAEFLDSILAQLEESSPVKLSYPLNAKNQRLAKLGFPPSAVPEELTCTINYVLPELAITLDNNLLICINTLHACYQQELKNAQEATNKQSLYTDYMINPTNRSILQSCKIDQQIELATERFLLTLENWYILTVKSTKLPFAQNNAFYSYLADNLYELSKSEQLPDLTLEDKYLIFVHLSQHSKSILYQCNHNQAFKKIVITGIQAWLDQKHLHQLDNAIASLPNFIDIIYTLALNQLYELENISSAKIANIVQQASLTTKKTLVLNYLATELQPSVLKIFPEFNPTLTPKFTPHQIDFENFIPSIKLAANQWLESIKDGKNLHEQLLSAINKSLDHISLQELSIDELLLALQQRFLVNFFEIKFHKELLSDYSPQGQATLHKVLNGMDKKFFNPLVTPPTLIHVPVTINNGNRIYDFFTLCKIWHANQNIFLNPANNQPLVDISFDMKFYQDLQKELERNILLIKQQELTTICNIAQQQQLLPENSSYKVIPPNLISSNLNSSIINHPVTLDNTYTMDLEVLKKFWDQHPNKKFHNPYTGKYFTHIAYNHALRHELKLFLTAPEKYLPREQRITNIKDRPITSNCLHRFYQMQSHKPGLQGLCNEQDETTLNKTLDNSFYRFDFGL